MNEKINVRGLFPDTVPGIIMLSLKHFPRTETCVVCKAYLVERLRDASDRRTEGTRIKFGHTYKTWKEGGDIYCPHCKLLYRYPATKRTLLERYVSCAQRKGILAITVKEEFALSRFDSKSQEIVPADSTVYAISSGNMTTLYELKEGYAPADAYTDFGMSIRVRNTSAWNDIAAVDCYRTLQDLFDSVNAVSIPHGLLLFPKLSE